MRRHAWLGILSVLAVIGCDAPAPLSLHDLVADARHNNGAVVRIAGCYRGGVATSYLADCDAPSPDFTIWVDDYDFARATVGSLPDAAKHSLLPRGKVSDRDVQIGRKLLESRTAKPVHVVLDGEFQEQAGAFGPAGVDWRLVLHKVVSCEGCDLKN
jgi:hypothetical protein